MYRPSYFNETIYKLLMGPFHYFNLMFFVRIFVNMCPGHDGKELKMFVLIKIFKFGGIILITFFNFKIKQMIGISINAEEK